MNTLSIRELKPETPPHRTRPTLAAGELCKKIFTLELRKEKKIKNKKITDTCQQIKNLNGGGNNINKPISFFFFKLLDNFKLANRKNGLKVIMFKLLYIQW